MSSEKGTPEAINAIVTARHNIALVKEWSQGIDYNHFKNDMIRRYAVQYAFVVIGEAVKDIPPPLREKYGRHIPWRKVVGFRDWLVHTYDDLPDPRIMNTINEDLPELDEVLIKLLAAIG